ncbi:MAG: ATP-dependent helicase, partial [Candidatus Methanomethylophilaceae archaeon]|nr:ATP-dependent helicase [Candidatus Methanomethylophilaceae archaeon]
RKAIINASPLSAERTTEGLNNLSKASAVAQNPSGAYVEVPDNGMGHREALKEVTRKLFREFGIFSAETLSYFLQQRKMHSVRDALANLEEEGFLFKGFFEEGSPTVYWMLAADVGKPVPEASGFTILNTQDNLHVYLRHMGRTETSLSVVFKGTETVGRFRGRITSEEAKVEEFEGTDEALAAVKDIAVSMGVRIDRGEKDEDEDKYWDASEFYLKMNPGAKNQR